MEKPNKDTTTPSYLEHSAFTASGVAAEPEIAGLEGPLAAEHVILKKQNRDLEDLEEEVQAKRAIFLGKDRRLDRVVRDYELRLFGLVDKKRSDPRYRRYFKDGLREVTEAEPRVAEPALVADILKSLIEDQDTPDLGPLSKEFVPQFQAALAEVVKAAADLGEAETNAAYLENTTIPATRARWTDAYVTLHGALQKAFPRDPARVEAFFYPFRKDKKAKKADDAKPEEKAAPAPTAGAATAGGSAPAPGEAVPAEG